MVNFSDYNDLALRGSPGDRLHPVAADAAPEFFVRLNLFPVLFLFAQERHVAELVDEAQATRFDSRENARARAILQGWTDKDFTIEEVK